MSNLGENSSANVTLYPEKYCQKILVVSGIESCSSVQQLGHSCSTDVKLFVVK